MASGGYLLSGTALSGTQFTSLAAANNLAPDLLGDNGIVSGATQINLLSNVGRPAGTRITLVFSSTPTVKHATATSGTNQTILLQGAVDLVAAANTVLTLVNDGTSWQEVARKTAAAAPTGVAIGDSPTWTGTHIFSESVTVNKRFHTFKGANVASANDITLGDGNVFTVTGTTAVHRILQLGWQAGDEVLLLFPSVSTIGGGAATSGGYAKILVFSPGQAVSSIRLVYDGTNFIQAGYHIGTPYPT